MRAAGHIDQVPGVDALSVDPNPSHPTPVTVDRGRVSRSSVRRNEGSLRGWPAQLAQWAIIFGVLGLIIAGAKWWDRNFRVAEPIPPVAIAAESATPRVARATVDGQPTTPPARELGDR